MSTSQASLPFAWKEEVNRRLAEHRNRKGSSASATERSSMPHRSGSRRGAEAAARVAERFAHARSYSDMLAEEASAEHSALALHAVEQPVLSGFETGAGTERIAMAAQDRYEDTAALAWEGAQDPQAISAAPAVETIPIRNAAESRMEDVLSFSETATAAVQMQAEGLGETEVEEAIEPAEPVQPLHANLIEFPRELVATRKIRPRLAEGPYATANSAQLRIFEVDPGTISTEPTTDALEAAPAWTEPEWAGMELDAQPEEELAKEEAAAIAAAQATPVIEQASLSRRMLAVVVDGSLVSTALVGAAAAFGANVANIPGPRELGIGAGAALLVIGALYVTLFFAMAQATPGMRYARVQLSTFGGEKPTRTQRLRRLATMALSVLPLGLGLVWSLFDDERFCWHDRLSQTYLRNSF